MSLTYLDHDSSTRLSQTDNHEDPIVKFTDNHEDIIVKSGAILMSRHILAFRVAGRI